MNTHDQESLSRIIDMFLSDEKQHFEENGKPDNHIYRDLLVLKRHLATESSLLEAAQGILDDEDDTGCEFCSVVSMSALEKLTKAVEAANPNV